MILRGLLGISVSREDIFIKKQNVQFVKLMQICDR